MRIHSIKRFVIGFICGVMPFFFSYEGFSSELSRDKEKLWEMTQQNLKKEFGVCVEHCGNDSACREKCEKAYKSRLNNEYRKLILEEGSKLAPKDGC